LSNVPGESPMPKSFDADAVVSKRQLAKLMGLVIRAVDECRAAGAPVERCGGYRPARFFKWYRSQHKENDHGQIAA